MKKFFLFAALAISAATQAATPADTIAIDQSQCSKWIEHKTKNAKGADVVKYFCIYKDNLVTTTKATYEKASLCKQLGAKCALFCIGKKTKVGFTPKRIVAQ